MPHPSSSNANLESVDYLRGYKETFLKSVPPSSGYVASPWLAYSLLSAWVGSIEAAREAGI